MKHISLTQQNLFGVQLSVVKPYIPIFKLDIEKLIKMCAGKRATTGYQQ
jgi:hypothetical protein